MFEATKALQELDEYGALLADVFLISETSTKPISPEFKFVAFCPSMPVAWEQGTTKAEAKRKFLDTYPDIAGIPYQFQRPLQERMQKEFENA